MFYSVSYIDGLREQKCSCMNKIILFELRKNWNA